MGKARPNKRNRMRRAYLKRYTLRNPSSVNKERVSEYHDHVRSMKGIPTKKGVVFDKAPSTRLRLKDYVGLDINAQYDQWPRLVVVDQWRRLVQSDRLQKYEVWNRINYMTSRYWILDLFVSADLYIWVEQNNKEHYVRRSKMYRGRDQATIAWESKSIEWVEKLTAEELARGVPNLLKGTSTGAPVG